MGQIIVRNLDGVVIARLKARALANKTSLEQTVRDILVKATERERDEIWRRIDAIREEIGPVPGDSTPLIREDRDTR